MELILEIERKAAKLSISPEEFAEFIDHTRLSPFSRQNSMERFCNEAKKYGFGRVCVHPFWIRFCIEQLRGTDIKVATVVGFPMGQNSPEVKAFEAGRAVEEGASEIDMVMNISAFKDGQHDFVKEDIRGVVESAKGIPVKVILEVGYLTYEEVVEACKLVKAAGADFVKTSTGLGPLGATIPHVYLMRQTVGPGFGVKAAGGISSFRDAMRMIAAGANRIGTSSGVRIMEGFLQEGRTEWLFEEVPCRLCPSRKANFDKMPKSVYAYYKSKCLECPYNELNRFHE